MFDPVEYLRILRPDLTDSDLIFLSDFVRSFVSPSDVRTDGSIPYRIVVPPVLHSLLDRWDPIPPHVIPEGFTLWNPDKGPPRV